MKPILFQIGDITIYSYGVMIAIGYIVAYSLMLRHGKSMGFKESDLSFLTFMCLGLGLLGARAYYVSFNWDYFKNNLIEIPMFFKGGLVIYGALLGMLIAILVVSKLRNISFLKLLDSFCPYLAIAQSFGRWGCYLNGCCYGPPDVPVQIINALGLMILAYLLIKLQSKSYSRHCEERSEEAISKPVEIASASPRNDAPQEGMVAVAYGVGYGIFRFHTEFLRADQLPWLGGLTEAQVFSIGLVVLSVLGYLRLKNAK